jgi:hypothetical protein
VSSLLRIRAARLYLVGQAFSMLGDSALLLAAAIWVEELTGSDGAAGLTAASGIGLLVGERTDQAKAIGRRPRSGSRGVSRARRSPTASSSSGT